MASLKGVLQAILELVLGQNMEDDERTRASARGESVPSQVDVDAYSDDGSAIGFADDGD
ncbi:MAG: hypothetical protein KF809_14495 [Chloroflexi bacterium]|nr:hypothetical protein [Chloroflexota bacterium]